MKKTRSTMIKLKKDDAALVIKNNDELQIFIPAGNDDEEVGAGILTIVVIGMLLDEKDKSLCNLILKRTKKFMKDHKVPTKESEKKNGRTAKKKVLRGSRK
jgi:hypothetical protein